MGQADGLIVEAAGGATVRRGNPDEGASGRRQAWGCQNLGMTLDPPHLASGPRGWLSLLEAEGQQRLVLVLNHVVGSEPVAQERLKPHAGRRLQLTPAGWPAMLNWVLPQPQPFTVAITRAGLFEWVPSGAAAAADLVIAVDTTDPLAMVARVVAGGTPSLQLQGDAALAAEVNWMAEHLRWDVAADLERLFGPVPAESLARWGGALGQALKDALERFTPSAFRR